MVKSFKTFKIDLIVWKYSFTVKVICFFRKFKIDLIVWKLKETASGEITTFRLK